MLSDATDPTTGPYLPDSPDYVDFLRNAPIENAQKSRDTTISPLLILAGIALAAFLLMKKKR